MQRPDYYRYLSNSTRTVVAKAEKRPSSRKPRQVSRDSGFFADVDPNGTCDAMPLLREMKYNAGY